MPELKCLLGMPFRGQQWVLKLLAGGVITLIPLVNIMSLGYFVHCINSGQRGRRCLPEWWDWQDYIRQGCTMLLIILIYLVAAALIVWLAMCIPVAGTLLSTLLFLVIILVIPMALANYALHYVFQDGLMIVDIIRMTARVAGVYATAFLLALLIVSIAWALLLAFPVLGLLSGLIIFYTGIIYSYILGSLHREAL
ncbi:MAG: DUF4013 domain-containing protein [Syntrophomonadaceae bacterium]